MRQPILTEKWKCEGCSGLNPLRRRTCRSCGAAVPGRILEEIYKEEIKVQNIFFRGVRREKEIRRCEKTGRVLKKLQMAMIIVLIVVFAAGNGARFYFYPRQTGSAGQAYLQDRTNRLEYEGSQLADHFTGLQGLPGLVGDLWGSVSGAAEDVIQGVTEEQKGPKKDLNEDKIEDIMEKIRGVIEYVTGKLR